MHNRRGTSALLDHVFTATSGISHVSNSIGKPMGKSFLEGFNGRDYAKYSLNYIV